MLIQQSSECVDPQGTNFLCSLEGALSGIATLWSEHEDLRGPGYSLGRESDSMFLE